MKKKLEVIKFFLYREQSSTDQTYSTPKKTENQYQLDSSIVALVDSLADNNIDIQTKRLYKKYLSRKQQEYERKKEVSCYVKGVNDLI